MLGAGSLLPPLGSQGQEVIRLAQPVLIVNLAETHLAITPLGNCEDVLRKEELREKNAPQNGQPSIGSRSKGKCCFPASPALKSSGRASVSLRKTGSQGLQPFCIPVLDSQCR